jgi:hypothetical protein
MSTVNISFRLFIKAFFMSKRPRGRPFKLGFTRVTVNIPTVVADLMREIADLKGVTLGDTYTSFLLGALPALEHTKKLYEDLARLPEESKEVFLSSLNQQVSALESAIDTARQIDIFNNGQKT